ncbi:hypothetical protein [Rodentibacter genomosp. 1]|uniref:hypothetical protein n=1 Tax=Rodentibacter genomosp. 1 TaxID=1908264 RepID=UPI001ABEEC3A|nr:hypothetical protein [Rodentibacter genomosp. 1]
MNDVTVQNNLVDLSYHLNILYSDIREIVYQEKNEILKEKEVSIVLITKVLLGTLGCIPSYDRFFVNGIQKNDITKNIYQLTSIKKSIYQLAEFYEKNRAIFEEVRASSNIDGKLPYPQMKLLDLGFWIIGSKNEK